MKNLISNPILVPIEINLIEDIIKIISQAIHRQFSHDDIDFIKKTLIAKREDAIEESQKKME